MDVLAKSKEFVHALSNKLLPLHGRISLLKIQKDSVSEQQLEDLERLTDTIMDMLNEFREELATHSQQDKTPNK